MHSGLGYTSEGLVDHMSNLGGISITDMSVVAEINLKM